MKLYTYRLIDGRFVTYAGATEPAAFRRAQSYHGVAVEGLELLHHVCHCSEKKALTAREAGWLICARPQCAGFING